MLLDYKLVNVASKITTTLLFLLSRLSKACARATFVLRTPSTTSGMSPLGKTARTGHPRRWWRPYAIWRLRSRIGSATSRWQQLVDISPINHMLHFLSLSSR